MHNPQQSGVLDHPGARPQSPGAAQGRPVGVALVALMFLSYAVIKGFEAFSAFQAVNLPGLSPTARSDAQFDLIRSLVELLIYVVTAFGVWRLRQWGWYLALAFLAFNIVRAVITTFNFPLPHNLLEALNQSIIPITIMLYLLHPMIRPVFRRRDG